MTFGSRRLRRLAWWLHLGFELLFDLATGGLEKPYAPRPDERAR